MQKKIIGAVLFVVIVAGGAFYAGTVYGKGGGRSMGQFGPTNVAFNGNGQFRGGTGARGSGLTAGDIISKDASGVTIKMQDGSTKIIVLAPSTTITKSAAGTLEDLTVGTSVAITGTTNSDSSVTAQMVQIRPAGFGGMGSTTRVTR
jgi:hypothetical protein